MGLAATLVEFFLVGLATPLTAACALPLYPGFVVYLTEQARGAGRDARRADTGAGTGVDAGADTGGGVGSDSGTGSGPDVAEGGTTPVTESVSAVDDPGDAAAGDVAPGDADTPDGDGGAGLSPAVVGVLVVAGVVSFMLAVGVVFSFLLEVSLTGVVGTVSPVAFGALALVSLALLFDADVFYRVPTVDPPTVSHPAGTAFAYGFFFGAIVVPCNPGLVAFFLARQFLVTDPVGKLAGFLAFALGIGAPLLALALVSEAAGRRVTRTLARHRSPINRVSGLVMLAVSAYYLLAVFDVFGVGSALGL